MNELERKGISIVEFKADAEGSFRAVFATMNVVDKDDDVTRPGAFTKGQEVRIAQWGHNWGALPIGKGVIDADETKAWVDGSFFMDTTHGADAYKVIKALGSLQEWSYGFEVTKSSNGQHDGRSVRFLEGLNVFEVSPVMLGAGVGTHTEAIKSQTAAEDFEFAETASKKFVERMQVFQTMRAKEGRVLSQANRDRLKRHLETLGTVRDEIEKLLAETEDDPKSGPVSAVAEYAHLQQMIARRNGVAV